MIASNLPDLDVLVFATSASSVAFRRGWTHGTIAQALLPVACAGLMFAVARRLPPRADAAPPRFLGLLLLSYAGLLLHVFMDFLNNYGVRLLFPFDRRWFYGDTLFIIDPWLWLVLGGGVWWARRKHSPAPARLAVAAAGLYIAVMLMSARAARDIVADAWTAANGAPPQALMVGPLPLTPFERAVVLDAGDRYATGTFTWLPPEVRFDPEAVPKNATEPGVAAARATGVMDGFLVWSRFPYWTLEPENGSTRVSVGDMRFRQRPALLRGRGGFGESVLLGD